MDQATKDKTKAETRIMVLEAKKKNYIYYLKEKIEEEDWHGVSDAANDLREITIALTMLRE